MARVCERYAPSTIDFLKIDVESYEREVLEGADWGRFRPRVVLIEATQPSTTIPCHEEWESLLLSADYLFVFFDGLNRYYVRAEDRELIPLLSVPANVLDDFETFEHHDRVREFLESTDKIHAELENTRAALAQSRESLAESRREFATTLAALDETRRLLEEMRGHLAGTRTELDIARARLELFEGWGPMTVSVVRKLRCIASTLPLAKPLLRRAIFLRREFLIALAGGRVPR